jgi:hypothetical protein
MSSTFKHRIASFTHLQHCAVTVTSLCTWAMPRLWSSQSQSHREASQYKLRTDNLYFLVVTMPSACGSEADGKANGKYLCPRRSWTVASEQRFDRVLGHQKVACAKLFHMFCGNSIQ